MHARSAVVHLFNANAGEIELCSKSSTKEENEVRLSCVPYIEYDFRDINRHDQDEASGLGLRYSRTKRNWFFVSFWRLTYFGNCGRSSLLKLTHGTELGNRLAGGFNAKFAGCLNA